jgi:hypothetical protein
MIGNQDKQQKQRKGEKQILIGQRVWKLASGIYKPAILNSNSLPKKM